MPEIITPQTQKEKFDAEVLNFVDDINNVLKKETVFPFFIYCDNIYYKQHILSVIEYYKSIGWKVNVGIIDIFGYYRSKFSFDLRDGQKFYLQFSYPSKLTIFIKKILLKIKSLFNKKEEGNFLGRGSSIYRF